MSITSISRSVYCFHVDILGRRRALLTMYASQAAKSVRVVTPPGINEAVLRLCCVHNYDNHDVNYDFVNDRGPM